MVIDKNFYNDRVTTDFFEDKIEQVVWHELGHCYLGIHEHDNSIMKEDRECYNSIMSSTAFSTYEIKNCFLRYKNHYIEDLFYNKGGVRN